MMNEDTVTKLIEMKMSGMADAYKQQAQNKQYNELGFEERFKLLVDSEHSRRKSNRLQRLIRQAAFEVPSASIEEIQYFEDRRLPKEEILRLASGLYLENKNNIILMGATGAGKTYLACAFGIAACRQFYKVQYVRLPELLDEFKIAKNQPDDSYKKLMRKYTKKELLIIDEWLLHDLSEEELYLVSTEQTIIFQKSWLRTDKKVLLEPKRPLEKWRKESPFEFWTDSKKRSIK